MGFGGPMPPPGFGGRESLTIDGLFSSSNTIPSARPPFPPGPGGFPMMPPGAPPFPPNGAPPSGFPPGKRLSKGANSHLTSYLNSGGPSFPPNGGPPFPPGGMNVPPGFSAAGAVFTPPPSQGSPPNPSNGPPPSGGAAPGIHPDRLRMMGANR